MPAFEIDDARALRRSPSVVSVGNSNSGLSPRSYATTFSRFVGADRHLWKRQIRHTQQEFWPACWSIGRNSSSSLAISSPSVRIVVINCSRSAGSFVFDTAFEPSLRCALSPSTRPRSSRRDTSTARMSSIGAVAFSVLRACPDHVRLLTNQANIEHGKYPFQMCSRTMQSFPRPSRREDRVGVQSAVMRVIPSDPWSPFQPGRNLYHAS